MKDKIIEMFSLSTDSPYPKESIDIKSFMNFMKNEFSYNVDIHDKEALEQIYIKKKLNIPDLMILKNLSILLDDSQNCFNLKERDRCISFGEFKEMVFISNRSKDNELVYEDKNAISGVLAPIHKYIFRSDKNVLLSPFEHPIENAVVYNFDNLTTIRAGSSGNHRIYGCLLFAPLLEDTSIMLNKLYIYTPNENFYKQIYYLQEIIKFFDFKKFNTVIEFSRNNDLETIENGLYIVEVSITVCSEDRKLLELINMSLKDIYDSCNEKLLASIFEMDGLSRKFNKLKFSRRKNEDYVVDDSINTYPVSIDIAYYRLHLMSLPIHKKMLFFTQKILHENFKF